MSRETSFDAIVIGGGHAGVEAVRAISAQGLRTALLTLDDQKIGAMSCNPAIGGVAKSHLVFEIDALGGAMGWTADRSGIQARRLNLNKGPAVRSTRVQCDKDIYQRLLSSELPTWKNVRVVQGEAADLILDETKKKIAGVRLAGGESIFARAVVITSGTFMGGIMFCGDNRSVGGRFGDKASVGLSAAVRELGHSIKRLKTGTPARLNAKTIDFSKWENQWGDPERRFFSWRSEDAKASKLPQLSCYHGYTNERTHEVIRANMHRSPLFSGDIVGVGPRYCPSIEDKIRRFADRERHQIFLEPEGLNSNSIYPNGMSTSLPEDVQLEYFRTMAGLERVEFLRPGYAVEYDVFDPTELTSGFQSKQLGGLFFAGQVNRTSGYEEAGAQGLWAGINAGQYVLDRPEVIPDRSRSYLETLVDDLVTKGTEEPYRMFTSRSEFRLLLREDNAHERLFDLGRRLNLISDDQALWLDSVKQRMSSLKDIVHKERIRIDENRVISFYEYLKRPEVSWETLDLPISSDWDDRSLEHVEIEAKYSGYLVKQENELREYQKLQSQELDLSIDLLSIPTLSKEVLEKVSKAKPRTVRELAMISGVTPAAVITIARHAGRGCFT